MKLLLTSAIVLALGTGCRTTNSNTVKAAEQSAPASGPKLCAAIRGNGARAWAHYGALAKILETQGLIDGVAGGSSGSITVFLYESIMANQELRRGCQGGACSDSDVAKRAAFMLKTMAFWPDWAMATDEVKAVQHLVATANALKSVDLVALVQTDIGTVLAELGRVKDLLTAAEIRALVNQEFVRFVFDQDLFFANTDASRKAIAFRGKEAKEAITNLGKFDATSPSVFVRPGIIDFHAVGVLWGHLGDFYAGYDPGTQGDWQPLFAACADTTGKLPADFKDSDCGRQTVAMMTKFFQNLDGVTKHRVDEVVGAHLPTIVATALMLPRAFDRFEATRADYLAGRDFKMNTTSDDFAYGYAGSGAFLTGAEANIKKYPDLRSQHFTNLGAMTWRDILSLSPAEPGIANAQAFTDAHGNSYKSLGGWGDLSPVMALKAGGCEKVAFITRTGEDSSFARQIATQVGGATMAEALVSSTMPTATFRTALSTADAVFCTRWDDVDASGLGGIANLYKVAYTDGQYLTDARSGAPDGCQKP